VQQRLLRACCEHRVWPDQINVARCVAARAAISRSWCICFRSPNMPICHTCMYSSLTRLDMCSSMRVTEFVV
jgi:hypothetical protein